MHRAIIYNDSSANKGGVADLISEKIIQIKDAMGKSELVSDRALFKKVTECCIPGKVPAMVRNNEPPAAWRCS